MPYRLCRCNAKLSTPGGLGHMFGGRRGEAKCIDFSLSSILGARAFVWYASCFSMWLPVDRVAWVVGFLGF